MSHHLQASAGPWESKTLSMVFLPCSWALLVALAALLGESLSDSEFVCVFSLYQMRRVRKAIGHQCWLESVGTVHVSECLNNN